MVASILVSLCTIITILAVINNFMQARTSESVHCEKKSIVETGTMTLFFMLYYMLVRNHIGSIDVSDYFVRLALTITGTVLVVVGCIVNIAGRIKLGGNWGNQIVIYKDHTLITGGVYRLVRHPLYASLIWMFLGASLVYCNGAAFLANVLIFLPFMRYRAQQEEELLTKKFAGYQTYRHRIGMFFPILGRKDDENERM